MKIPASDSSSISLSSLLSSLLSVSHGFCSPRRLGPLYDPQWPLTCIRWFLIRGQSFPTRVIGRDTMRGRCTSGTNLDDVMEASDDDDVDAYDVLLVSAVDVVTDDDESPSSLFSVSPVLLSDDVDEMISVLEPLLITIDFAVEGSRARRLLSSSLIRLSSWALTVSASKRQSFVIIPFMCLNSFRCRSINRCLDAQGLQGHEESSAGTIDSVEVARAGFVS
mmetsp:Transcript_5952/g.14407  ORF Transcript_5952/g.14407 Transcript_5952/m.14407 type:complete len:222 (-) Transcript_5952:954-1619(-)